MLIEADSNAWARTRNALLEDDCSYCRRRAAEERALALEAGDPRVRQVHLDMAARYEDLGRAIQLFERHLGHKLEVVA